MTRADDARVHLGHQRRQDNATATQIRDQLRFVGATNSASFTV